MADSGQIERVTEYRIHGTDEWTTLKITASMSRGSEEPVPPLQSRVLIPESTHYSAVSDLTDALRYILGEDVAGYEAHMRPEEVARAALEKFNA